MGTKLFLAACMWLFLPIVYVTMRNNLVCKNNLILSVTLPPEAQTDEEVAEYCRNFRKKLFRTTLWLTAALLPAILLPRISFSITWSLVWLLAAMFGIMRCYGKGYEGLKAIKQRRGWKKEAAGQTVAELQDIPLPKRLKPVWFVLPMLLSVLPVLSCLVDSWDPGWHTLLAITAGCNLFITALSFVSYGLIFRQRKDVLDEDFELTAALTRVRRYNWTKCWLWMSWSTALYSLAVWCTQGNMTWYLIWTIVYCVVLTTAAIATEFAARRAQQRLTQGRTQTPVVDEDDYWIWGQFYCNPNSNKFMINERVGVGMSVNFAHPAGKITALLTILLMLSLPILGVWTMYDELAGTYWKITDQTLIVEQSTEICRISLNDIEEATLLEELPPSARLWGTGLPNLLKGSFSVEGYGTCTLCLDPTQPPFLLIKTTDKTYLFGIENATALLTELQK